MFAVHGGTSRTSENLSQQLTAGQNEPPLNVLQTHNLSTEVQKAAEHESRCKKMLPRKMPTHDSTNNTQRTQDARRHLLTNLSNAHNSCYCSWLFTLPNYIQHDFKKSLF